MAESKRYILEVYELDSDSSVWESIESDHPFGAFSAGDGLNTEQTSHTGGMGSVRIRRVEHILWNRPEGAKHKICLFTERVERES